MTPAVVDSTKGEGSGLLWGAAWCIIYILRDRILPRARPGEERVSATHCSCYSNNSRQQLSQQGLH
jgi:hypothetical protein